MSPTSPRALLALTLLAPLLWLAGCASSSPPAVLPLHQQASIPPLPAQARQTGSPTYSASASSAIEQWLLMLTPPSSPAGPASAPTTR